MTTRFLLSASVMVLLFACHPLKRIEHKKILTNLLQIYPEQQKTLKNLQIKNDSLTKAGYYSTGYAQKINTQINEQRRQIDSSFEDIGKLLRTVNFRVAYEEQYYEIRKKIKKKEKETVAFANGLTAAYTRIDEQMNQSDLEGEKKELKTILNNAEQKQEQSKAKANEISNQKDAALQNGSISKFENESIDIRLKTYLKGIDSISNEINILKNRLDQPADFSKNITVIKSKVLLVDSVVNSRTSYHQFVFRMMEDGLSKSKRTLFNMAAFFGAGGYEIPADKHQYAVTYFSPVIDSLLSFSNKYSSIFRKAQIAVIGYADATNIAKGSPLYQKLKTWLAIENPTRQELNMALSSLRAEEISKFMEKMVKERGGEFVEIKKIVFEILESGEGETLPDRSITNYTTSDVRRRIVMLYWTVLPIE